MSDPPPRIILNARLPDDSKDPLMLARLLLALFFIGCVWLETRSDSNPNAPRAKAAPAAAPHLEKAERQGLVDHLLMTAIDPGYARSIREKAGKQGSGSLR